MLTKFRHAIDVIRLVGLRFFLKWLRHRLYSRAVFLYLELQLDSYQSQSTSSDTLSIKPASREEVEKFFDEIHSESKEGRYDLLERKWFYERGFHNCYIARTTNTNEMCNIQWEITAQDIAQVGFEEHLPRLESGDVLQENTYTLERLRGRRVFDDTTRQMINYYIQQGFKRYVTQVPEDRIPSLVLARRLGGKIFEKAEERFFLFRSKRSTIERFDPPVDIVITRQREGKGPRTFQIN